MSVLTHIDPSIKGEAHRIVCIKMTILFFFISALHLNYFSLQAHYISLLFMFSLNVKSANR